MGFIKKIDNPAGCPAHRHRFLRFRPNPARIRHSLRFLPNVFTLSNALFGFCSITFAAYGDMIAAAYFILLGALMDALDGRIARFARVTSELGLQLDSLCDGISFCLAPAVLVYLWQLRHVWGLGFAACALFLLAGLLRLAKFNLTHAQQSIQFCGVPTTIAGCFLATLVLNSKAIVFRPVPITLLLGLVILLAFLMISSIPFPAFKQVSKGAVTIAILSFSAFIIAMGLVKMLLALFVLYFLFAIEELFRNKYFHRADPHDSNNQQAL